LPLRSTGFGRFDAALRRGERIIYGSVELHLNLLAAQQIRPVPGSPESATEADIQRSE